ncbi:MAG: hypothetical protein ABI361_03225 [Nitrososphaera sp.]
MPSDAFRQRYAESARRTNEFRLALTAAKSPDSSSNETMFDLMVSEGWEPESIDRVSGSIAR